ncbi:monovalent cation/H(+) antiporter subunit G [Microbacterium sp.]|uniref:monovalent cation/H(+) antiporter subunit G n=1 Tax=Microbacterium sp. TaxID=51671 RepID=UPI00281188E5|nr:monovalent cation/H(+) antiporter subunit G [Microbacterium sp.]
MNLADLLETELPAAFVDTTVVTLVLIGAALCVSAAVGLLRFPDVPSRLHAATKPQVLGLVLICLAIAVSQRTVGGILLGMLIVAPVVLMQFATAPLSAHIVGRQAYRNGAIPAHTLVVDEYDESKRTPPAAG